MIGWTTVGAEEVAGQLARNAVEAGVAACVQIDGPIQSFYEWKGKIEVEREWRLVFKFAANRAEALEAWIEANHPYETPQWVACRADRVAPAYARWVLGAVDD